MRIAIIYWAFVVAWLFPIAVYGYLYTLCGPFKIDAWNVSGLSSKRIQTLFCGAYRPDFQLLLTCVLVLPAF